MRYSVAIEESEHQLLFRHLMREDQQEDLCFALFNLSSGSSRQTAVIKQVIWPDRDDRVVHGNVSFTAQYFDRVISLAIEQQCGICFLHSHHAGGWQQMSRDDIRAEQLLAPRVKAATGLPLFGLTLGKDHFWSARAWIKTAPKTYRRIDCHEVRVVGTAIRQSVNEQLFPHLEFDESFVRTISAWGAGKQSLLARMTIGIVGLGSVGSIVAEALVKIGVRRLILIDFDIVKRKNLDRLNGIGKADLGRLKVNAIQSYLQKVAATDELEIIVIPASIAEKEGLSAALNCDILFSCVDRPWPRYILNNIAYGNLIPVIDGGIDCSANKSQTNLDQARWKAHATAPGRRCLCCLGQYCPEDVALEQSGLLEDPHYISQLPPDHFVHRGENVYAFSLGLAGMLLQQFLSLFLQPKGQYCGAKEYNFNSGNIDADFEFACNNNCEFSGELKAQGDKLNRHLSARHITAEESRASALAEPAEPVSKNKWLAVYRWLFGHFKK